MTDKPTPTTDLLKRCAEIHEWRSTGVLSGEALRDYAKRKWPDRHDTLQMAEHETVTEALALLAKWGQPAGVEEPFCWHWENTFNGGTGTVKKNPETLGINMSHPDYKWTALYTAPQPVERAPLTANQVSGLAESAGYWHGDMSRADFINGIRCAEVAHGIKGDQHDR